jgi:hypothetical protein
MAFVEFNRFDVATKELLWDDPAAWLERFGIGPPGPVEVIDSDITVLTAAADKVIKVGGPDPYLVNVELQSSHDSDLVETLWFRQAALFRRHRLPASLYWSCCAGKRTRRTFPAHSRVACQMAGVRIGTIIELCGSGKRVQSLTLRRG